MDSVTHFELPAADRKRATNFYHNTFGWAPAPEIPGMEYTIVGTGPSDKNGRPTTPGVINGGIGPKKAPLTQTVITIQVADIDAALTKVNKNGGKTLRAKDKVGDMGFAAYFTDTEGNVVGLWQAVGPR